MAPSQPALLAQAIGLHQAGRIDEASRLFNDVLSADPRELTALQHLAIIHANRGEFGEAEKLFRRAVDADPASAEAHSNLGRVLAARGRHREAISCFGHALALRPGMVEAEFNLGALHHKLGHRAKAIDHLRRTVQLRPEFSEAVCLLAVALQEQGESGQALGLLSTAVAARPRDATLHHALGRLHASEGDIAAAKQHFEAAIAGKPDWGVPYYELSQIHRFTRDDPRIADMERLLRNPAVLGLDGRVGLHMALYKAHCDTGQDEAAFAHLLAANRVRRAAIPYEEKAAAARDRAIREVFSPSFIAGQAAEGSPSQLPIFVVGFPRSGTSLVEQILASHPQVHGAGELPDIADMAKGLAKPGLGYPASLAQADGLLVASLGADYASRLARLAPQAARVVDKMPDNYRHLGLIHLILPQAPIVHIRRDPLDTCFSCFENDFGERQPFSYDMEELGRRYAGYLEMMAHWRRVLPPGRLLEIDYESLVGDLPTGAGRLLAHCGLAWDERCLRFHETRRAVFTQSHAQVRQPLYSSSIGRWRRFESSLQPLVTALGKLQ